MSARSWLNLALVAVVLTLAGIALFEPGLAPPAAPTVLVDRSPEAISAIRVERPEQSAVVLERREGRWQEIAPLDLPANDFRVRALLEVLGAKSEGRLAAAGLELARFGLDPPKATLLLDDLRLEFGDTEPLSGRRYVRLGDEVHLIVDRFYHQLVGGASSFVDLSPLGPAPQPIAIDLPGLRLRQEDGRWRMEPEPVGQGADAATRLVDAWRYAQAITVRPYEPVPSDSPPLTVVLKGREEPLRFQVVETPEALVLARAEAGVQYQFPSEAAERLLRLPPPPAPVAPARATTESGPGQPGEEASAGETGFPGEEELPEAGGAEGLEGQGSEAPVDQRPPPE